MRIRSAAPVVAVALAAVPFLPALSSGAPAKSEPRTTQSLSNNEIVAPTWKTFTTTAGRGTVIKISNGGNLTSYLSPNLPGQQYEHIGVGAFSEGYVLCYTGLAGSAYDLGDSSSGFNAPVVSATAINRTTSDGKVRLTQTYTFSPGGATGGTNLTVTMKIKNLTGANLNNVIVRRQVDFDIDTGGPQGWAGFVSNHARTRSAVMAFHDPAEAPPGSEAHGIMLSSQAAVGTVSSLVTASILPSDCNPAAAPQTPEFISRGDFGDTIKYDMGTIPGGATKTVAVRYQRY